MFVLSDDIIRDKKAIFVMHFVHSLPSNLGKGTNTIIIMSGFHSALDIYI